MDDISDNFKLIICTLENIEGTRIGYVIKPEFMTVFKRGSIGFADSKSKYGIKNILIY